MATVVKLIGVYGLRRTLTFKPLIGTCLHRTITTSKKNKDGQVIHNPVEGLKTAEDFAKPDLEKNWIFYGFDHRSKVDDEASMHLTFFFTMFVFFGFMTFSVIYYPDLKRIDWVHREAYLRLRERERLGLPPIDYNYIDPSKMVLPSDEELGDQEVIV